MMRRQVEITFSFWSNIFFTMKYHDHTDMYICIFVKDSLTCQPWSRRLLSTVLSHITASPAWKSLNRVHFLCRKTPRHFKSSDVEAWITVFLGPGGNGFCTNFSHVGLCVVWLLLDAGALVCRKEFDLIRFHSIRFDSIWFYLEFDYFRDINAT